MNDRFKLRAFYRPTRRMFGTFGEESEEICAVGVNKTITDYLEDDNWIVMQCTDFRDRRGKLIWEGDIVKHDVGVYPVARNYVVRHGEYKISINGGEYEAWGYGHHFGAVLESYELLNNTPRSQLEVIGNIYDNPELLEDK